MHMYNFLCSDSLLYFFLFLSTLHSVYTRDCSCASHPLHDQSSWVKNSWFCTKTRNPQNMTPRKFPTIQVFYVIYILHCISSLTYISLYDIVCYIYTALYLLTNIYITIQVLYVIYILHCILSLTYISLYRYCMLYIYYIVSPH